MSLHVSSASLYFFTLFFSHLRFSIRMACYIVGDQHCQSHVTMLNCLETVITDIHIDITGIDSEVNKCFPDNHQLPSNMITPPFFKEPVVKTQVWSGILPVVAELTKTNPATTSSTTSCLGTSCVPELPSILLSIEKEVNRHVQYVSYIQEKMNAIPSATSNLSMGASRSQLQHSASMGRSKIRTNPGLPVLQRSPKVHNLSQSHLYDITSVSQQLNSSIAISGPTQYVSADQQKPPCLCCKRCSNALRWISDHVCNKIQQLKDHCHDLKSRLIEELKEKEKQLMIQLASSRKAKQTVTNNFNHLEGLGPQGLTVCSNIQIFEPIYQNCRRVNYGTSKRHAADGQSCDEEQSVFYTAQSMSTTSTQLSSGVPTVTPSVAVSSVPNASPESSMPSMSTTEGSYSFPIITFPEQSLPLAPQVSLSSDPNTIITDNIYDEPVVSRTHPLKSSTPQVLPTDISYIAQSPLQKLLEFQRLRSNSLNQDRSSSTSNSFRRRSHTISNPASANHMFIASGSYASIDETSDPDTLEPTIPKLFHVQSDIAVTFPANQPRKTKSTILSRASKLKQFITNKFQRKSWGGQASKKSSSSPTECKSPAAVQFFEYDFSDDNTDHQPLETSSDDLHDLSMVSCIADTLASHSVLRTTTSSTSTMQMRTKTVPEMTFSQSCLTSSSSIQSNVANLDKSFSKSTASNQADLPLPSKPKSPSTLKPIQSRVKTPAKQSFITHLRQGAVLLSIPPVSTAAHHEDLLIQRQSIDSLSVMSGIDPVQSPASVNISSLDISQPDHFSNISSRKRLMFQTPVAPTPSRESIYYFHDDSSFDTTQGYSSFHKLQKIANTPAHSLPSSLSTQRSSIPVSPVSSNMSTQRSSIPINLVPSSLCTQRPSIPVPVPSSIPTLVPELITYLCQGPVSGDGLQNMVGLSQLKPYLLRGRITLSYLLYLICNYPQNYDEVPGYDPVTKQISMAMVTLVSAQTTKPHIFSRNLIWRLFTLAELYGGNTDSLTQDVVFAVREATYKQYNISSVFWQKKCLSFIHESINYLFRRKLRHPVFRCLLQQSVC